MASLKKTYDNLKRRMARIREEGKEHIDTAVSAVEVTGTAAGLAYLRARFPKELSNGQVVDELEVGGIPVSLLGGVGIHALAFLGGVPSEYRFHAHNIANGMLADYSSQIAFKFGRDSLNEARKREQKPALPGGSNQANDSVLSGYDYGPGNQHAFGPASMSASPFAYQNQAFQGY
jgi:hypothetical protein